MGRIRISYTERVDFIHALERLNSECFLCEDITVRVDSAPLNVKIKSNDNYGIGAIETTIYNTETFNIKINGHKSKEDSLNTFTSSITVVVRDLRDNSIVDFYETTRKHTGEIC